MIVHYCKSFVISHWTINVKDWVEWAFNQRKDGYFTYSDNTDRLFSFTCSLILKIRPLKVTKNFREVSSLNNFWILAGNNPNTQWQPFLTAENILRKLHFVSWKGEVPNFMVKHFEDDISDLEVGTLTWNSFHPVQLEKNIFFYQIVPFS